MSLCQIELMNAGKPYPRTCQTCGLGGACVKGLERGVPDRNPRPLPEFDANGWCHDMIKAPRDGSWVLVTANSWQGDMMVVGWHFGCWRDNQDPDAHEYTPTAWRPLPLPPVVEQDQ